MHKAHKIQLLPTERQLRFFAMSAGVARHSYNWALAKWKELYQNGKKPSYYSVVKLQNSIKRQQFPFYMEVGKCAPQYAIHHLEKAFKKMWKEKSGYPRFKKKGINDSFVSIQGKNNFKQHNKKIWVPRLGWVKCCEDLRFEGKINNVVIKREANKWFAIVNIEVPMEAPIAGENQAVVGVDVGISKLMTCSDGLVIDNPRSLASNLKSLKRLQRSVSRKQKGSNNRKKAIAKLSVKHYRVKNIRHNAIHHATTKILKKYDTVVIEDLNVKGMLKNKRLSQSIGDSSFGEIKRQFQYKADWMGKTIVFADRFYPSSKLCSSCGSKKDKLSLNERVYKCVSCGLEMDRDLNAAKNLAMLALPVKDGEVKPVEQTQMLDLSDRVALKQELFINRTLNQLFQAELDAEKLLSIRKTINEEYQCQ